MRETEGKTRDTKGEVETERKLWGTGGDEGDQGKMRETEGRFESEGKLWETEGGN